MLADLPPHSLTALYLRVQSSTGADGSTLSALLARLSSLQQLRLSTNFALEAPRLGISGSCLAGITCLSQLTELVLEGSWRQAEQPLQQLLGQRLPLRRLELQLSPMPVVNMTSLTSLEEFEARFTLRRGSVLPEQLQRLHLYSCPRNSYFSALQHLQALGLGVQFDDRAQLLGLAQLPSLRHLSMCCQCCQYCSTGSSRSVILAATAAAAGAASGV
jgi:hypothetical protein